MARYTRPKEVRIAEIDERIKKYQERIAHSQQKIQELQEKRENILNPKPRKARASMAQIVKQAKENGMTVEEIAKKLGIEYE